MAAISKAWVTIADGAIDPDSPLDTVLLTGLRDDVIHLREWIGAGYTAGAVQNHNHDGLNSASITIGPNALRNGSFEDDAAGWTLTNYGGGSNAISSSTRHHGAKSLSFTSTVLANGGGDARSNEFVPCSGAEAVLFEVDRSASAAGVSSKAEVIWYDAGQAQISATTLYVDTYSTPQTVTRARAIATAPAAARFWRTRITGGVPAAGTATGTIFFDGVYALPFVNRSFTGAYVPVKILKFGGLNIPASATRFARVPGATLATAGGVNNRWQVPARGTIGKLMVRLSEVLAAANVVFTVQKNGVDTGITCTVTGQESSDLTNTVDVEDGDSIGLKLVAGAIGASGGVADFGASLGIWLRDSPVKAGMPYINGTATLTGGTGIAHVIGEMHFNNVTDVAATNANVPLPPAYVLEGSGGALSDTLKNGVAYPDTPNTTPRRHWYAEGDRYRGHSELDNLGADTFFIHNLEALDKSSYAPCPFFAHSELQAQATTFFTSSYGNTFASATESDVEMPVSRMTMRTLRACLQSAVAAGQTVTVTLRKNGADALGPGGTAQSVTIQNSDGTSVVSDLTRPVEFADGDRFCYKVVLSATAGTRTTSICGEPFVN